MKHFLIILILFSSCLVNAGQNTNESVLEAYLDSLIEANDINYLLAHEELLTYSKKNYKSMDDVKDFVAYSSHKMKSKEKEYTKLFTKELHELQAFGIVAHKNLIAIEKKLFSILDFGNATKSNDLVTVLYLTLHEMNYWELNCYKPNQLGAKLEKLYSTTSNYALVEKINLLIMAAKIYKASYFVNPMHICESSYAKTEIIVDIDSLNLNTNNITIDSIPSGTRPPMFIGGPEMLKNYVKSNLKYPEKALEQQQQGRVLVSFKVDERGNVFDTKVKKSPSELLSKEVIRIIESLPQWQPDADTKAGAGFTKFTMPFDFVLPEK